MQFPIRHQTRQCLLGHAVEIRSDRGDHGSARLDQETQNKKIDHQIANGRREGPSVGGQDWAR